MGSKYFRHTFKQDIKLLLPFMIIALILGIPTCLSNLTGTIDWGKGLNYQGIFIVCAGLFAVIHKEFQFELYGNNSYLTHQINCNPDTVIQSKITSVIICASLTGIVDLILALNAGNLQLGSSAWFNPMYLITDILFNVELIIVISMLLSLIMLFATNIVRKKEMAVQLLFEGAVYGVAAFVLLDSIRIIESFMVISDAKIQELVKEGNSIEDILSVSELIFFRNEVVGCVVVLILMGLCGLIIRTICKHFELNLDKPYVFSSRKASSKTSKFAKVYFLNLKRDIILSILMVIVLNRFVELPVLCLYMALITSFISIYIDTYMNAGNLNLMIPIKRGSLILAKELSLITVNLMWTILFCVFAEGFLIYYSLHILGVIVLSTLGIVIGSSLKNFKRTLSVLLAITLWLVYYQLWGNNYSRIYNNHVDFLGMVNDINQYNREILVLSMSAVLILFIALFLTRVIANRKSELI